jgi:hypothetical protein
MQGGRKDFNVGIKVDSETKIETFLSKKLN